MRALCLTLIALCLAAPSTTHAREAREQARIDFLISGLGSLPGAVFIRNGTEYKASDAESHLRQKLAYAGERVRTAEEFVKACASESSMSHKPYKIRFADGRTVETAVYFADQLKKFDARNH